jgi:hypothetical protein
MSQEFNLPKKFREKQGRKLTRRINALSSLTDYFKQERGLDCFLKYSFSIIHFLLNNSRYLSLY